MQTLRIAHRPIEDLEEDLISHAQRMNVLEYEFLLLIRDYEIRQGWRTWHLNNCAEWLNMKCGLSLGAAREKVRVAMALLDLPRCSEALKEGKLSYSKARAITRAADRATEEEYLAFAKDQPVSRVEDYCRRRRNAKRKESTADANQSHRGRYLSCFPSPDGGVVVSVELPQEQGELFQKALELAMATLEADTRKDSDVHCFEERKEGKEDSFFQKQADAFVEITRGYLAGNTGKTASTADHYQVVVHVDEKALLEEAGKSDLPIETVRRLCCDASLVPVVDDSQGNPLNLGRKQRVVSPALRRALLARDEHCRFPGCAHKKWLDAHHVMHWADGGATSLENTMLLCTKHHHLLHEGGYTIEKDHEGRFYFRSSQGKVMPDVHWAHASRDGFDLADAVSEPAAEYRVFSRYHHHRGGLIAAANTC